MTLRFKTLLIGLIVHLSIASAQVTPEAIDSLNLTAGKTISFDQSNNLYKKNYSKAKSIGYLKGQVDATMGVAMNFHNHGKFEESIRITTNLEKMALATRNNKIVAHLYALRANSYCRLSFFEKSSEYLDRALSYAKKITDIDSRNSSLGRIYGIRAIIFKYQKAIPKHLDSALYYRMLSYKIQKKNTTKGGTKANLVIQTNDIGRIHILKGNLDSSKYYYNESIKIIRENNLDKYLGDAFLGLGDIYHAKKNLDSALLFYHEALQISLQTKTISVAQECYKKLALLYEETGELKKSYDYLKKHAKLVDSLTTANKNAVKISADFILKEQETIFKRTTTYYLVVIGCSILVLLVIVYLLVLLRKRFKKGIAIHKEKQEYLYEKLALLKDKSSSDKVDETSLKQIIELAASNDPTFLIKFQEHHSIFIQKLMERAPNLVTSDLLICAQLRLGFYTKEIARYTKTSVRAVEGKKYRIRKKLDIPAAEDINVWMMKV